MNRTIPKNNSPLVERLLLKFGMLKPVVAPDLQLAIDNCNTEEQLIQLLFSSGTLGETEINAFDKRFAELEQSE